jgi:hypothetical protein
LALAGKVESRPQRLDLRRVAIRGFFVERCAHWVRFGQINRISVVVATEVDARDLLFSERNSSRTHHYDDLVGAGLHCERQNRREPQNYRE